MGQARCVCLEGIQQDTALLSAAQGYLGIGLIAPTA